MMKQLFAQAMIGPAALAVVTNDFFVDIPL